MVKKLTAIILAVMMIVSVLAITAVAEEKDPVITFDVQSSGWEGYSRIFCHVWAYGGSGFFDWQTKKERCTDNGDGTWSYDLASKGITLEEGQMYCVIFSDDNNKETYQCFMDTSCFGDTLYCDGTMTENPVDSSKKSETTYWKNADKTKYGPVLAITSIGNVVGTACAPDTTPYDMFINFLKDTLENAREFSNKSDQELISAIAAGLGLTNEQVIQAIIEADADVDWAPAEVPTEAPTQPATPDEPKPVHGDANRDGKLDIVDATVIQRYLAQLITEDAIDLDAAKVTGRSTVSIIDATRIQKFLAGICDLDGNKPSTPDQA